MSFFYDREETEAEIVIRYKPTWIYVATGLVLSMLSLGLLQQNMTISPVPNGVAMWCLIGLAVWYALDTRRVRREIFAAMRQGQISMRGSRFRPKDPITFTIHKPESSD